MTSRVGVVGVLVRDQDEALRFYTEKLGFEKRADVTMDDGFRWLTVSPREQKDIEIGLAVADNEVRLSSVGKQVGDHVLFVLYTDDCCREYETLSSRGVKFHSAPEDRAWGIEAIFEDLYGNMIDLLEPRPYAG
jgi:catechol 2,3-dioxygenase-like lactoylglutathione lyase family enzyme